jgi:hypothetical protein
MRLLLGYFNAKEGIEDIFTPTIGNESLQEFSSDNGTKVIILQHLKNHCQNYNVHTLQHSYTYTHTYIYVYIRTSPDGNAHNKIYHILINRRRHAGVLDVRPFRAADCDTDQNLWEAKIKKNSTEQTRIAQLSYGEVQFQGVKRSRV